MSLPPEVLRRLALNARLVERVQQLNSRRVNEARQLHYLPSRRVVNNTALVEARANSLPLEVRERLAGHARILHEMSPYPRAGGGTGSGPTAKAANHPHLPSDRWRADDEEDETHLKVSKVLGPIPPYQDEDEEENERLAWKAVAWAQRVAAERFGA